MNPAPDSSPAPNPSGTSPPPRPNEAHGQDVGACDKTDAGFAAPVLPALPISPPEPDGCDRSRRRRPSDPAITHLCQLAATDPQRALDDLRLLVRDQRINPVRALGALIRVSVFERHISRNLPIDLLPSQEDRVGLLLRFRATGIGRKLLQSAQLTPQMEQLLWCRLGAIHGAKKLQKSYEQYVTPQVALGAWQRSVRWNVLEHQAGLAALAQQMSYRNSLHIALHSGRDALRGVVYRLQQRVRRLFGHPTTDPPFLSATQYHRLVQIGVRFGPERLREIAGWRFSAKLLDAAIAATMTSANLYQATRIASARLLLEGREPTVEARRKLLLQVCEGVLARELAPAKRRIIELYLSILRSGHVPVAEIIPRLKRLPSERRDELEGVLQSAHPSSARAALAILCDASEPAEVLPLLREYLAIDSRTLSQESFSHFLELRKQQPATAERYVRSFRSLARIITLGRETAEGGALSYLAAFPPRTCSPERALTLQRELSDSPAASQDQSIQGLFPLGGSTTGITPSTLPFLYRLASAHAPSAGELAKHVARAVRGIPLNDATPNFLTALVDAPGSSEAAKLRHNAQTLLVSSTPADRWRGVLSMHEMLHQLEDQLLDVAPRLAKPFLLHAADVETLRRGGEVQGVHVSQSEIPDRVREDPDLWARWLTQEVLRQKLPFVVESTELTRHLRGARRPTSIEEAFIQGCRNLIRQARDQLRASCTSVLSDGDESLFLSFPKAVLALLAPAASGLCSGADRAALLEKRTSRGILFHPFELLHKGTVLLHRGTDPHGRPLLLLRVTLDASLMRKQDGVHFSRRLFRCALEIAAQRGEALYIPENGEARHYTHNPELAKAALSLVGRRQAISPFPLYRDQICRWASPVLADRLA